LLAVTAALVVLAPWMGRELAAFAAKSFVQAAAEGAR
jgi:type III secretory pathway component EscS